MPIDSALNSASNNLTHFFKYAGVVPRKAAKLENPAKILRKLIAFSLKMGEEVEP